MKIRNPGDFFRKTAKTVIRIWPYMVFSLLLVSVVVIFVFINTAYKNQGGESVQSSGASGDSPASSNAADTSSGKAGDTSLSMEPALCPVKGPVTAYGLCPFEYGTVSLVSEKLAVTMETDKYTLFNKDELFYGTDTVLYDVQMEYTVKTVSKARFTLPFAAVLPDCLEKAGTEIAVDGKKIEYTASTHPLISVSRQSIDSLGVLSDGLSCEFVMDSYKKYMAAETIGTDTNIIYNHYNLLNLFDFYIDTPGKHTVTIKTKLVGSEENAANYDVQWADSSSSMWTNTGERRLTLNTPDGTDEYSIPDDVLNCCIPRSME